MNGDLPAVKPDRSGVSRRGFLGGAIAAGAGAAAVAATGIRPRPVSANAPNQARRHLVWVWQFSMDAAPNQIAAVLRDHNLGIVLKTHDGIEWMSKYDKSPFSVSGPDQIRTLAGYYDGAGVPFHAWALVKGINPLQEARMAADVLAAGARSIYLDLEPHSGFWQGSQADAIIYGNELRRLQPNAWVVTSVDPRPWAVQKIPLREFASFSNEIAPQQYWKTFDTSANYEKYAAAGFPTPSGGITPEFLLDVSNAVLPPYGLPVNPVGQGASGNTGEWKRFIDKAYSLGSNLVSVWRYGVTSSDLLDLLTATPPRQPPPPPAAEQSYTVQSGDTLGVIAGRFGVSVDAIVQLNALDDPDFLSIGQQLLIPVP